MKATVHKEILSLALPAIITNITTPLLALMDVVIVGHLGSAVYIAAIALGGNIFNLLYWLFSFLRMGTGGLTAQANGAGLRHAVDASLWRGLAVATAASAAILLLQVPVFRGVIVFLSPGGEVVDFTWQYFRILVWGAPASLGLFVMTGWFAGLKDAKTPMWIAFLVNVSNIAVSLTFVYGLGMKIEGLAVGTLTAQWVGFTVALVVAVFKYRPRRTGTAVIFSAAELRRFFGVNVFLFIRTLLLIFVTLWFTRVGAQQSTLMLAVNTLLMQFFIIFSYFMDGFAFAGESLCGNAAGAGDHEALRTTVTALFRWGWWMALLFTAGYFLLGDISLTLLTDDRQVRDAAREFLPMVVSVPLLSFAAFVWDGVYIGLTRTSHMLLAMAAAAGVFYILYLLLFPVAGNYGLWAAFLAYLLTRGLVLWCAYRKK